MIRLVYLLMVLVVISGQIYGGAEKKSKSEVTFKGFGKFTVDAAEKVSADKKRSDSKTNFKGKGLMGGLAGKLLLRSGEEGEIIDLNAMSIYKMNHKEKEYQVMPIEKLKMPESAEGEDNGKTPAEEPGQNEAKESDVRVVRSEFKVTDTGEAKTINNFPCRRFNILWLTEWESVSSGVRGIDSLSTDVWTTALTADLQQAQEEEMQFSRAYMEKLGIDMDQMQQAILGTNWMSILNQLNQSPDNPQAEDSRISDEMKKIEGYPVLIDGKYFAIRPGEGGDGEQQPEEAEEDVNPKKMFGGFAKKLMKKKEAPKELEPAFAYYTELLEYKAAQPAESDFTVPANYKQK